MAGKKSLPTREQADAAFLWHTQDIFESDEQFLKALERLKECAGQLSAFQGKLGDAKMLLRCLQIADQLSVSAVARGAEAPGRRGSYYGKNADAADWSWLAGWTIITTAFLWLGGVRI